MATTEGKIKELKMIVMMARGAKGKPQQIRNAKREIAKLLTAKRQREMEIENK